MKKEELESKYNIIINFFKDNIDYKYLASVSATFSVILVGCLYAKYDTSKYTNNIDIDKMNYNFSTVSSETGDYYVKDLYSVHKDDSTLICNKGLDNLNEYVYFDIKTGNIVCKDKDKEVLIEKLSDMELQEIFKSYDYHVSIDEMESYLSREGRVL